MVSRTSSLSVEQDSTSDSLQRVCEIWSLILMVPLPLNVLPSPISRRVHPRSAQEVHAALRPPARKLRGRREAPAAVSRHWVLEKCRSLGRGWDVSDCSRRYGTSYRGAMLFPLLKLGVGGQVLHAHPTSVLFTRKPRTGWVVFHEMEETKKTQYVPTRLYV
jgi:hypothetical protein